MSSLINLFDNSFLKEIERDTIAAVGISLVRNKKVVTARTIKSVRAVTTFFPSDSVIDVSAYGGEGLPYIITDKPANTKYPMDFKGTTVGPTGREKKIFELKPRLKDWKTVIGFEGPDFLLARSIAENPRKAIDISVEAIKEINRTVTPKVMKRYGSLFATFIIDNFEDDASTT